jgi:hypothetical protein
MRRWIGDWPFRRAEQECARYGRLLRDSEEIVEQGEGAVRDVLTMA